MKRMMENHDVWICRLYRLRMMGCLDLQWTIPQRVSFANYLQEFAGYSHPRTCFSSSFKAFVRVPGRIEWGVFCGLQICLTESPS
jgi:hypothetical protein